RRLRADRRHHPGVPRPDHQRGSRPGRRRPRRLQRPARADRSPPDRDRPARGQLRGADAVRLRRTLIFVPGVTPERIAKAAASRADGVILDLEGAVAPPQKGQAREWVVAALRRVDFGARERIVRVNPLDTPTGLADLAAVAPLGPDAVLLPKVRGPADVE